MQKVENSKNVLIPSQNLTVKWLKFSCWALSEGRIRMAYIFDKLMGSNSD